VALEAIHTSLQNKRSVYTIWLRFLVFIGVLVSTFILVSPSFLFSYYDSNLPWNEQSRIIPQGQTLTKTPSADQPKIVDVLRYRAEVYQDDSSRGKVNLIIYPDGIVKGIWNGEYDNDDSHCIVLAASFAGNIDPSKPCIENNTHNASKLYFITSGTFTMLETSVSKGRNSSINGLIYVRGWLDPNLNTTGELFVTENKKSFEVFSWSAEPAN
jgi:hypothetical protein